MSVQARPLVLGWLTAAGQSTRAWPGVLLHRDAFLVKAPRAVLLDASAHLQVILDSPDNSRLVCSGGPLQNNRVMVSETVSQQAEQYLSLRQPMNIRSVKVLEVDGYPDDPATAMLRLSADSGFDVSTVIDRGGFDIAIRVTGDAWQAFDTLGLIPDSLQDRPPAVIPRQAAKPADAPATTTEIVAVGPAGWCDIFWWLC